MEYLALHIGSIFTANSITKYLKSQMVKMSTTTMIQYIQALHDVFLIRRTKRKDVVGKKIFDINEKVFFSDL
jgi:predicted AAA+ superfamily ATPase